MSTTQSNPNHGGIEKLPQNQMSKIKNVIAIMSGKGGVGKSLVTGLLAVGLAKKGYKTGILDADITGPSIPKMFNIKKKPEGSEMGILPGDSKLGIRIISINLFLENEDQPVIWRGPLMAGAIKQFWSDVVWGDLDYLLIDLPPGTGDAPLTVMQSLPLDGVVIVTSPQDLAFMVVKKAINMARNMNIDILGIVENMSYFICSGCGEKNYIFGKSGIEEKVKNLDFEMLSELPIDPVISKMCDEGRIEDYESDNLKSFVEKVATMTLAGKSLSK
jgi:Mrp family chromosome partitioning ATPase